MNYVGKKIKIVSLQDEPKNSPYIGKEGIVHEQGTDPWGDTYLRGAWGGISVYPEKDNIVILDEMSENKDTNEPKVLTCEGYKMFEGIMEITPKSDKFPKQQITATWLYKPEYDCWYGNGWSHPAEICRIVESFLK